MNIDDVCTLCGNPIGDCEVCVLEKSQLSTFIKKSKKREDTLWKSWEGKESVQVHIACRGRYSAKLDAPPAKKKKLSEKETVECPVPSPSQCSVSPLPTNSEFDFKNMCFFCNKPLDSKHKKVIQVQNAYLKYKLLDIAENRNDDCGREMILRLNSVNCLVMSKASYHKLCYGRFVSSVQTAPKIPATKERLEEAFNNVTNFIETSHTYRFGMNELRKKMGDDYMTDEMFFKRLKERYGDDIYVDRHRGRETKVYYKRFEIPIICSDWFCDNNLVNQRQKFIITNIVAEMIRTEIQEMKAENQSYSPATKFLDSVSTSIPPLLQNFLSKLVYSDKSNEEDQNSVKLDIIAHSIISMIRPKSFISNLQLAIATYVHRKAGSKLIIDLLSKLGICATYYSLQLFEASTIKNLPEVIIDDDTFVQFVFGNTDHNVGTLDGQETFHCLGGIAAYCPKENISYQGGSKKLKKMPTAHEIASLKKIEIVSYQCPDISGMKDITFVNTASLDCGDAPSLSLPYGTYLWSKYFGIPQIPSWRGFMEVLTDDEILEQHVDLAESRISRDKEDIQKLLFWLNTHDPFYPRSSVVSLSTGVFGGPEINCHMAIEKGQQAMATMIGKNAEDVSLSRLYRVKNLSNAGTEVHLSDGKPHVKIDSYLLFQRISVGLGKNPEESNEV
ncbi:Protein of unknown function [Cotesia congregata]|uniref:Uncharacterized protein n=1 Tax=Cotesia congregata TaxID=51543 RepID=A0A8J2HQZ2_COTCN|nr:Protein of unknown function [Cotesia congregata]